MSLRARLIIGVMLLVTVAIGTLSTITYVALRSFLISRIDSQLALIPPSLVESFCDRMPGPMHGPPGPPTRVLLARLNADGTPVGTCTTTGLSEPLRLSQTDGSRLLATRGAPLMVMSDDVTTRALARPLWSGGFGVVALPMDEVHATLQRLLALELLVGVLTLAGAGVLGAWGLRWGLYPLDRVTSTARAVAEGVSSGHGGLAHRVPAGPEGTEVGQLAEAFNTMLTSVQTEVAVRQDSEQRMRQFLADASHELRTPLTSLRGYAELLALRERRAGAERDADSADALRRMIDEGARLSRLVEDLLTVARSDRTDEGPRRAEGEVALDQLAADAVADLRAAHPRREVTVDIPDDPAPVVRGDPDQLRQVLVNLLGNAATHTRPDGPIRVSVRSAAPMVELVVADGGPGLTPRQAAHVFDRFWRADTARTRATGGSGLGLSIVDTLVSAHGGTIDFETSPANGTVVTVRLPLAAP